MKQRLTPTLVLVDGDIACEDCGSPLCPEGQAWKGHAVVDEQAVASLIGKPLAPSPDVRIRRFFCPSCGALLDSETALAGDGYLDDVVYSAFVEDRNSTP